LLARRLLFASGNGNREQQRPGKTSQEGGPEMKAALSIVLSVASVFCLVGTLFASNVYDGEWSGQTPEGDPVLLTVENDHVVMATFEPTYECMNGSETSAWAHTRTVSAPVEDGRFLVAGELDEHGIMPGSQFPFIIKGQLDVQTGKVEGRIIAVTSGFDGKTQAPKTFKYMRDWRGVRRSLTPGGPDMEPGSCSLAE